MKSFHYQPSLIVGLGGSGIRTLRYIESIADSQDPNLKEALRAHIDMVGIDLDELSNIKEPQRDTQTIQNSAMAHEPIPDELKRLSRNWMCFSPQDLNRNLEKIWAGLQCVNSVPEYASRFSNFSSWLPTFENNQPHNLKEKFLSSNDSGGWRFKGRLAFFLNVSGIVSTFRIALQKIKGTGLVNARPTAVIVSSLAGGTGGGMFWDTAIVLKTLEPRLRIMGVFLLNQPFQGLGNGDNINANVYASLKEIQSQQEWLKHIEINYPGVQDNRLQRVTPNQSVFDSFFVTQGFPLGHTSNEDQIATLDSTCFRLAHLIRAFCRNDLESKVRSVGDDLFQIHPREEKLQRNLFKTAGCLWLPPLDKKIFAKAILFQFFDELKPKTFEDQEMDADTILAKLNLNAEAETWRILVHDLASQDSFNKHLAKFNENDPDKNLPNTIKHIIANKIKEKARELSQSAQKKIEDFQKADDNHRQLRKRLIHLDGLFVDDFATLMIENKTNKNNLIEIVFDDTSLDKYFEEMWLDKLKFIMDVEYELRNQKHFQDNVQIRIQDVINILKKVETSFVNQKDYPPGVKLEIKHLPEFQKLEPNMDNKDIYSRLVDKYLPGTPSILRLKTLALVYNSIAKLDENEFRIDNTPFYNVVIRTWHKTKDKLLKDLENIKAYINECIERDKKYIANTNTLNKFKIDKRKHITSPQNIDIIALQDFLKSIYTKYIRTNKTWAEDLSEKLSDQLIDLLATDTEKIDIDVHLSLTQKDSIINNSETLKTKTTLGNRENCYVALDFLGEYTKSIYDKAVTDNETKNQIREHFAKLLRFISKCLDEQFCQVYSYNSFDQVLELPKGIFSNWLDHRFTLLEKVTSQALEALSSQGVFSMLTGLDSDELEIRLKGAKSNAFENDLNSSNQSKLIALPYVLKSIKTIPDEELHNIKKTIQTAATNALGATAHVFQEETPKPIVFFYDLDKPAESIVDIENIFQDYREKAVVKEHALFHIDRNLTALPEANAPACHGPSLCGNDECNFDIRGVERSTSICPHCRNPILNRCGNDACREDQLHDYIKIYRENNNGKIPFNCPSCHLELKTYWWSCGYANHQRKIPMDKESCPECLKAAQAGKCSEADVTRRPDRSQHMACMGCHAQSTQPNAWFMIHSSIKQYVENGVNGHDSADFLKKMKVFQPNHKTVQPYECPNPHDLDNHALIPTCPVDRQEADGLHYLYRITDNTFACPRHVHLKFLNCNVCSYPILAGDSEQPCPRCLTLVHHCSYCSEAHNHYTPADETYKGRCSFCLNTLSHIEDLTTRGDIPDPGVCSNIYGCRAGSAIKEATTDRTKHKCSACPSLPAPLIPLQDREQIIHDCPLCHLVIEADIETEADIQRHLQQFIKDATLPNGIDLGQCRICRTHTNEIIHRLWSYSADKQDLDTASPPSNLSPQELKWLAQLRDAFETSKTRLPTIRWSNLDIIQILKILHQEQHDTNAFDRIERSIIRSYRNFSRLPMLMETVALFPSQGNVSGILEKRLKRMDTKLMEIARVEREWGGENSKH